MDTSNLFCPNPDCPAYGQVDAGNIGVHSRKEQRYRCRTCGKTFAATHGTPLYRLHHDRQLFGWVISLLSHGCPKEAIVATFDLDPRTVDRWWRSSGQHAQQIHQALVQRPRNLLQVQLDELRHKVQGAVLWIAMAIMVSTRLWLGATVSQRRDTDLIVRLVSLVKASALCRPLLLCFDGLSTYITACRRVFRTPLRTGQRGRPRLVPWPDLYLGQVIKQYARRRVVGVRRRRVQGSQAQIAQLIRRSQGKGTLNTAFIERLNATFRSRLALLVRRTRHLARKVDRVEAAIYLVGTVYNFCTYHDALRQPLYYAEGRRERRRWVPRTPAMAAGITDHRWSILELLSYRVSPLLLEASEGHHG